MNKKMVIIVLGLFLLVLALLGFKTFTKEKICGWEGMGKDWPCLCLGKRTEGCSSTVDWLTGECKKGLYYCTGFNLSCSEFALKYFYRGTQEKPNSCASCLSWQED
jgi:hypothetical protein